MKSELFTTKVAVPRRQKHVLPRPRLLERLSQVSPGSVIVVRGPAGYGKTTLMVDFSGQRENPALWVSLDEWDRDPKKFIEYLGLAIWGSAIRFDPETAPRDMLAQVTRLLGELPGNQLIVLDDFHCLDGAEDVIELVDYFAVRLPLNSTLLLVSRTQPVLPSLARLHLQGAVAELGPEDLAFNNDEIIGFFREFKGRELRAEEAERLLEVTGGWPAALAFLDPEDIDRVGSAALSQFVAAEVFKTLPPATASFLMNTSPLTVLTSDACDFLLERTGSSQILSSLNRENLPLVRLALEDSYRLHPILREFLLQRIAGEDPKLLRTLHERAADWFETAGQHDEAIWHRAQAKDWRSVARLVERHAEEAYRDGRWHAVTAWLQQIPKQSLKQFPALRLWESRILVRFGRADEALQIIDDADQTALSDEQRAGFDSIRAAALRGKGDMGAALSAAKRAVELAIAADSPVGVLNEARKQLGMTLLTEGSFREAEHELRSVLEIYERSGRTEEAATVNGCLGFALASLGQLNEAAVHLERCCEQWRKLGNVKETAWALNNLAMSYLMLGQTERSRRVLVEALTKARDSGYSKAEAYALVSLGDLDRLIRQLAVAEQEYEEGLTLAGQVGDSLLRTHALVGLSDIHRLKGNIALAQSMGRQALAGAQARESSFEEGLARMALGRVYRHRGEVLAAVSELIKARDAVRRLGPSKESIECLFLLASALLTLRPRRRELKTTLGELAAEVEGLGAIGILVQLAPEETELVSFASTQGIAKPFYRELLARISALTRPLSEQPSGDLPAVDVRALGPVNVSLDGRVIQDHEWEREKAKELLLVLMTADRALSRDEIVAHLWPDLGGRRSVNMFHSTLYQLRHVLYRNCITQSAGRYRLNNHGAFTSDVDRFKRSLEAARRAPGGSTECEAALSDAVRSYGGLFATGIDNEWIDNARRNLEHQFRDAATRLSSYQLNGEHLQEAEETCERLLQHDPYNEAGHLILMQVKARRSDVAAALQLAQQYTERLDLDLGQAPGPAISQLRDELMAYLKQPPATA